MKALTAIRDESLRRVATLDERQTRSHEQILLHIQGPYGVEVPPIEEIGTSILCVKGIVIACLAKRGIEQGDEQNEGNAQSSHVLKKRHY